MARPLHRGTKLCVLLFVAFVSILSLGEGYRRGDLVQMSKRSRYSVAHEETETKWSEIMARHCPRFRAAKSVTLANPMSLEGADASFDYKLAFSFADNTFITPWITIWDSNTRKVASYIEFTFVYSGNEMKEVRASVDYNDGEHQGKVFDSLWISYTWEEFGEQDIEFGMNLLLIGGFASVIALVVLIVIDVQMKIILSSHAGSKTGVTAFTDTPLTLGAYYDFPTLGVPFITSDYVPQPIAPQGQPVIEEFTEHTVPIREPREVVASTAENEDNSEVLHPMDEDEVGSFVNEMQPVEIGINSPGAVATVHLTQPIVRLPYSQTAKED